MQAILIIEDDATFGQRLALSFRRKGYRAEAVRDGASALGALRSAPFDAAVVDLCLEGENGLTVMRQLREEVPALPVVIITGYGSIATAKEALKLGAIDYLTKPTDAFQIEQALGLASGVESAPPTHRPPGEPDIPSLQRVEWEHLQRVLADVGGNISEAARRLGIERRTLQRKLAKYAPIS
jgi:two-component system response regulator RegA